MPNESSLKIRLNMKEDNGQSQKIWNFLSQLKLKARHCYLQIRCECTILVDYTEDLLLYMLVIGVANSELQENLLKVKKLNLSVSKKEIGDSTG